MFKDGWLKHGEDRAYEIMRGETPRVFIMAGPLGYTASFDNLVLAPMRDTKEEAMQDISRLICEGEAAIKARCLSTWAMSQ